MKRQTGFSLIELLISMTILVMVIFIGSFSFSIFSKLWTKGNAQYDDLIQQGQKHVLLNRAFADASNYLVHNEKGEAFYFFEGDNQSVTFVTRSPIISGGKIALVNFSVSRASDNQQQLIYREVDLIEADFFKRDQPPAFTHQKTLLESENIRFNYYGWRSNQQRLQRYDYDVDVAPEWSSSYSAQSTGMLPYIVNLSWGDNEPILFSLATDESLRIEMTQEKFKGG